MVLEDLAEVGVTAQAGALFCLTECFLLPLPGAWGRFGAPGRGAELPKLP